MVMVDLPNGQSYFLEKSLVKKLELMCKRMEGTDDNVILIDGDEGQGKSNMEAAIAGFVATRMKRPLSMEHMFFDLDKLIDYGVKTKEKILLWDEGALGGLAAEWWKRNQIKFIKFLMVARKKKHFIIICIPKFFKLTEYLVVDRSIALINVYSKHNIKKGRFRYFNKSAKEKLYDNYRRSKKRSYTRFMTFGGSFPIALPKVFNEQEYEKKKDEAILSIGEDAKKEKQLEEVKRIKGILAQVITDAKILENFAEAYGVEPETVKKWKGRYKNEANTGTVEASNPPKDANSNLRAISPMPSAS